MYPFVETIALKDGRLLNLCSHADRFDRTRNYMKWEKMDLIQILSDLNLPENGFIKVRVVYDEKQAEVSWELYNMPVIMRVGIVICEDICYNYKSTDRRIFAHLHQVYPGFDDFLIVKNGLFTDSTFCNIAFFKDGEWITPEKPLLEGTKRSLLLERKEIKKGNIELSRLREYTHISFFNALNEHGAHIVSISACECVGDFNPVF